MGLILFTQIYTSTRDPNLNDIQTALGRCRLMVSGPHCVLADLKMYTDPRSLNKGYSLNI